MACGSDAPKSPGATLEASWEDAPVSIAEFEHESGAECDDGDDNDGDGFVDCEDLDCRYQGEHCTLAPPLNRTRITTLAERAEYLFDGDDAVQKDVARSAFKEERLAIVRGEVIDGEGKPLPDVRVSVAESKDYGYTLTQRDGTYELAVNGGGVVTLRYHRDGYLRAARSVATRWRQTTHASAVGLVRRGRTRHTVLLGKPQLVVPDPEQDAAAPWLFIPEGTEAELVFSDGKREPVPEFHLRVTKFPDEPAERAPRPNQAPLYAPGTVTNGGGLSYSVDFEVEEATAAKARQVAFDRPVSVWVENYKKLPVGLVVPLRYYDEAAHTWQREHTGRVVEIVDVADGVAALDLDGDGKADTDEALAELGIQAAELSLLAQRYEAGRTLWRTQVTHFSAFSAAWRTLARGARLPPDIPGAVKEDVDNPTPRGSVLLENQTVQTAFGAQGTPYTLVYQTDRSEGYGSAFRVDIPLTNGAPPSGLRSVYVVVEVGGRSFSAEPHDPSDKTHEFVWDGKDEHGRLPQGGRATPLWRLPAKVAVTPGSSSNSSNRRLTSYESR